MSERFFNLLEGEEHQIEKQLRLVDRGCFLMLTAGAAPVPARDGLFECRKGDYASDKRSYDNA